MEPSKLFADYAVRLTALLIDIVLVLISLTLFRDFLIPSNYLKIFNQILFLPLIGVYFFLSWSSMLKATPGQLLLGIRVVNLKLEKLSYGQSVIRAVSVLLTVYLISLMGRINESQLFYFPLILGISFAIMAIVTPNRQAPHDYLSRSVVVNRKTFKDVEKKENLLKYLSKKAPYRMRRPPFYQIILNLIVLAAPLFLLQTTNNIRVQKDLHYRISYAIHQTKGLQDALAEHYIFHRRWPAVTALLMTAKRAEYPDGGYYELKDDGIISIHFTKLAMLKKNKILLIPEQVQDEIIWKCKLIGELENRYLPRSCRL